MTIPTRRLARAYARKKGRRIVAAQNLPAAFAGNREMVMHRIEKVSLSEAA